MLSAFNRAAGGLVGFLVAAIFGTAGTVMGAVVGLLSGFVNEDGLMQGSLTGAITGALVSVELADSLLRIWCSCCDDYSMHTRITRTILLLHSLTVGSLLSGRVFATVSRALDTQIHARQRISGPVDRGVDLFERMSGPVDGGGNLLEASYPTMAVRRAIIKSLPVTELTGATAGQQTTCPICLDEFQAGARARILPACCHVFHLACIDGWLMWNYECPICRQAVSTN